MKSAFVLDETPSLIQTRRGLLHTAHGDIETPFFMLTAPNGGA